MSNFLTLTSIRHDAKVSTARRALTPLSTITTTAASMPFNLHSTRHALMQMLCMMILGTLLCLAPVPVGAITTVSSQDPLLLPTPSPFDTVNLAKRQAVNTNNNHGAGAVPSHDPASRVIGVDPSVVPGGSVVVPPVPGGGGGGTGAGPAPLPSVIPVPVPSTVPSPPPPSPPPPSPPPPPPSPPPPPPSPVIPVPAPSPTSPIIPSIVVPAVVTSQIPRSPTIDTSPSTSISAPTIPPDTDSASRSNPSGAAVPNGSSASSSRSAPGTGVNVAIVCGVLAGAVVLGMIGIYIFRKTNLQPSKSFKQRINPNYRNSLSFPSFRRGAPDTTARASGLTATPGVEEVGAGAYDYPAFNPHGTLSSNYSGGGGAHGIQNSTLNSNGGLYQNNQQYYAAQPAHTAPSAGYGTSNMAYYPSTTSAQAHHYAPSNGSYYAHSASASQQPPPKSHYGNGY
ncbi:hypothetical protein BASA50_000932 [Batrachochytrium salamandrivorans]|uniref:Mid2 domain-containing protein n=1 Tax=Batrachochytrium salamandrivorans TaxID=1357716 RepID=A0ABQ8EVM2_9FUNG|nr:hypothetical protein BASA62_000991 [Batrachochytrium salamandrivorans]KAH6582275.1 hypothetical protein BASA60_002037 [Batrachochytrium salamandrivorans]KAH6585989.1 hypothetical protein BASA50_000932 [Batrachochytrium salamandrivorans]KAH6595798.1 hypothetical protein BASA61_003685 [Batrachochytrium salamandrivorans]KAH9275670.1 hypothetical protein BASA83_001969 [Batrachochytrium salamandrivorans]